MVTLVESEPRLRIDLQRARSLRRKLVDVRDLSLSDEFDIEWELLLRDLNKKAEWERWKVLET